MSGTLVSDAHCRVRKLSFFVLGASEKKRKLALVCVLVFLLLDEELLDRYLVSPDDCRLMLLLKKIPALKRQSVIVTDVGCCTYYSASIPTQPLLASTYRYCVAIDLSDASYVAS